MRKIGLFIGLALLLGGCARPDEVRISGVESFNLRGASLSQAAIELGVRAENRSASKITLLNGEFSLFRNGSKLLDLSLKERVSLHRKSDEVVTLPINIRFAGALGALGTVATLSRGVEGVTVSGKATLKIGWAKKSVSLRDQPLGPLLQHTDIRIDELLQYLKP